MKLATLPGKRPINAVFVSVGPRALLAVAVFSMAVSTGQAIEILGIGAASLLGGDLTDTDDVHDENAYNPPADFGGFDAEFFASDEASFGAGEAAFNVFDNAVGGGDDKWCCGTDFPQIVGAKFNQSFFLTHFTVTSGNDTDARRPRVWSIDGSNDGASWTPIFTQDDADAPLWTEHDQVIRFSMGTDFDIQTESYTQFRMNVTATGATGDPFFQINEIEFFGEGEAVIEGDVNGDGVADIADYAIIRDNFKMTPAQQSDGDLNIDNRVDLIDFRVWRHAAFATAGVSNVPEPTTVSLGVCGLLLLGMVTRRRR